MPACRYEPNIFLSQCGKAQHTLWWGVRSFPSQICSRHLSPSSRYAEAPSKLILWGLYQRKNHCKTTSKNRILTMPCIERSVPFIQRSFWSLFGGFCLYLTYSVHKNISGQQQHSLCLFYWQIPFCSVSGNPRKEWGRCFQWGQPGGAGTSQCHNNTFSRPSRVSTEDSLSLCSSFSWQHQS